MELIVISTLALDRKKHATVMGNAVMQVINAAKKEGVKKRTELDAPPDEMTSAFGMTVKKCMECTSVVELKPVKKMVRRDDIRGLSHDAKVCFYFLRKNGIYFVPLHYKERGVSTKNRDL